MAQANKKQQYVKAVSPILTLKFPKLSEPDYGTQDYPKPDGEYSTKGLLDADSPEAKKFIAQLQPYFDEAIADAERKFKELKVETRKKLGSVKVNDLFTTLYDQETEEPTGEIEFKFAMPASGTYKKGPKEGKKWSAKPGIVDSMGQIMPKPPAIWGGSRARISFEISPYFIPGTAAAGLKLRLVGVQIIELRTAGERSAASMGFDKVDGGFTASDFSGADDEAEDNGEEFGAEDQGGNDPAPGEGDF